MLQNGSSTLKEQAVGRSVTDNPNYVVQNNSITIIKPETRNIAAHNTTGLWIEDIIVSRAINDTETSQCGHTFPSLVPSLQLQLAMK